MKIFDFSERSRAEFKKATSDYLRTDLRDLNFRVYFDTEAEVMIMGQKHTYSFLETAMTAAINEQNPERAHFYYQWAKNIYSTLSEQHKQMPALTIIGGKLKYYEAKNMNSAVSLDEIEDRINAINVDNEFYYSGQIWYYRLLTISGKSSLAQTQLRSALEHAPQMYKDLFAKCLENRGELGCH